MMDETSGEEIVRGLMARKLSDPILVKSGYLRAEVVRGWFPGDPRFAFHNKPFAPNEFYAELARHFEPEPARP